VGLWTAIRIREQDPACDVVVLERDVCGGGASGRNGGFVLSWWPKIASLARLCGDADALAIARDSEVAIGEIGDFCRDHGIDAHFRRGGWLWTATTRAQLGAWDGVVAACERLGVEPFRPLSPVEIARRSGSAVHRAGVFEASAATVQPALLARGLRRVALASGVRIFEHTRVRSFSRGRPVLVRTDRGSLAVDRLVVATNAWAAGLRELAGRLVAITSDMVMTAPAPERLRAIGWTGGECITDSQTMVDYYHATRDGRVAFGKGGWGIAFGGRLGTDFDRNAARARMVEADLRRTYPNLADVPVTHDWSGPIDRTPTSLPLLGRLGGRPHILYGVGWSGNGVGPSVLGGRILASLALGKDDRWSRYPLLDRELGRFPREPIRFLGAHLVRASVARKERAERDDRAPSWMDVRLARLAPSGLEDKK
jgi:glycine/D-amino acid oxidase-like deaminating enzyme